MELKIKEKTNKKMMILSFLGILIVVLGHTGNSFKLASDFFPYYSFHMVLFIFISGYFYNPKNEENIFGKNGYIIKKIKKMLVPYFIWNIIYGILVNFLNKQNIVYYGEELCLKSLFVRPWTTGHQYILNIASWFILALFLVNIVYIVLRMLATKLKIWNDNLFTVIFLIISIGTVYLAKSNTIENNIPILRTAFFMFFINLDIGIKQRLKGNLKLILWLTLLH